ncbi:MAG: DUF1772 domain-containing protein [Azospirillaceae bacterium]
MSGEIVIALSLAASVASALIGGVLFAFSTFVMRALALRPAPEGIGAMQAINVTVMSPLVMGIYMGTVPLGIVATLAAWAAGWSGGAVLLMALAAATYTVGVVGVTGAGNVPLNNRLARLQPAEPESAGFWRHYCRRWTRLNHIRSVSGPAAGALFALAPLAA